MRNLFLFLGFIALISCKKNDHDGIIYGYEYFPITEGNFVVYEVVDIFHDEVLSPAHDTN